VERGGKGREGRGEGRDWGGAWAGRLPKLKLGPQNYFPGAGAADSSDVGVGNRALIDRGNSFFRCVAWGRYSILRL